MDRHQQQRHEQRHRPQEVARHGEHAQRIVRR
jgi:hypothetical protein